MADVPTRESKPDEFLRFTIWRAIPPVAFVGLCLYWSVVCPTYARDCSRSAAVHFLGSLAGLPWAFWAISLWSAPLSAAVYVQSCVFASIFRKSRGMGILVVGSYYAITALILFMAYSIGGGFA